MQKPIILRKQLKSFVSATTLRDVLRNVPGLTVTADEGGNVGGDNLTLRGLARETNIYVDGACDLSPQNRDPFNLEQVEVVKWETYGDQNAGRQLLSWARFTHTGESFGIYRTRCCVLSLSGRRCLFGRAFRWRCGVL